MYPITAVRYVLLASVLLTWSFAADGGHGLTGTAGLPSWQIIKPNKVASFSPYPPFIEGQSPKRTAEQQDEGLQCSQPMLCSNDPAAQLDIQAQEPVAPGDQLPEAVATAATPAAAAAAAQQQLQQQQGTSDTAQQQQQPPLGDAVQPQALAGAAAQPVPVPSTLIPAPATGSSPAKQRPPQPSPVRRLLNLAELSDGASVLAANPEAKRPERAIDKGIDSFMKNDCNADKWMIIELSQLGTVETVKLTMKELYSSRVHTFRVFGRSSHPRKDGPDLTASLASDAWQLLGRFTAENKRGTQAFSLPQRSRVRYLLLMFDTHYGSEAMCAMNWIEVLGVSAAQELEEALALQELEGEGDEQEQYQQQQLLLEQQLLQQAQEQQQLQQATAQSGATGGSISPSTDAWSTPLDNASTQTAAGTGAVAPSFTAQQQPATTESATSAVPQQDAQHQQASPLVLPAAPDASGSSSSSSSTPHVQQQQGAAAPKEQGSDGVPAPFGPDGVAAGGPTGPTVGTDKAAAEQTAAPAAASSSTPEAAASQQQGIGQTLPVAGTVQPGNPEAGPTQQQQQQQQPAAPAGKMPATASSREGVHSSSQAAAGGSDAQPAAPDKVGAAGADGATGPGSPGAAPGGSTGTAAAAAADGASASSAEAAGQQQSPDKAAGAAAVEGQAVQQAAGGSSSASAQAAEPASGQQQAPVPARSSDRAAVAGQAAAAGPAATAAGEASTPAGVPGAALAGQQEQQQQRPAGAAISSPLQQQQTREGASVLEGWSSTSKPKQAGNLFDIIKSEMMQLKLDQGKVSKKLDGLGKRSSDIEALAAALQQQQAQFMAQLDMLSARLDAVEAQQAKAEVVKQYNTHHHHHHHQPSRPGPSTSGSYHHGHHPHHHHAHSVQPGGPPAPHMGHMGASMYAGIPVCVNHLLVHTQLLLKPYYQWAVVMALSGTAALGLCMMLHPRCGQLPQVVRVVVVALVLLNGLMAALLSVWLLVLQGIWLGPHLHVPAEQQQVVVPPHRMLGNGTDWAQ